MKRTLSTFLNCTLAVLLFACGLLIYLYPAISAAVTTAHADKAVEQVYRLINDYSDNTSQSTESEQEPSDTDTDTDTDTGTDTDTDTASYTKLDELYRDMQAYNEKIYDENQSGLSDVWTYEQSSFDLASYGVYGAIGVLRIPAMNLEMPLYLGASTANMAYGAAQLGQTSMPIGGENTNCVIAGHRGYGGVPYFLYIQNLTIGDMVYIDNAWGTLAYSVCEIKVIQPNDIDSILIQDGRDMVTLITCHPYPTSRSRYVVYCTRTQFDDSTATLTDNSNTTATSSDTTAQASADTLSYTDISRILIYLDRVAYYVVVPLFVMALALYVMLISSHKRKR